MHVVASRLTWTLDGFSSRSWITKKNPQLFCRVNSSPSNGDSRTKNLPRFPPCLSLTPVFPKLAPFLRIHHTFSSQHTKIPAPSTFLIFTEGIASAISASFQHASLRGKKNSAPSFSAATIPRAANLLGKLLLLPHHQISPSIISQPSPTNNGGVFQVHI